MISKVLNHKEKPHVAKTCSAVVIHYASVEKLVLPRAACSCDWTPYSCDSKIVWVWIKLTIAWELSPHFPKFKRGEHSSPYFSRQDLSLKWICQLAKLAAPKPQRSSCLLFLSTGLNRALLFIWVLGCIILVLRVLYKHFTNWTFSLARELYTIVLTMGWKILTILIYFQWWKQNCSEKLGCVAKEKPFWFCLLSLESCHLMLPNVIVRAPQLFVVAGRGWSHQLLGWVSDFFTPLSITVGFWHWRNLVLSSIK